MMLIVTFFHFEDIAEMLSVCHIYFILTTPRMKQLEEKVMAGDYTLIWVHCNSGTHRAPQVGAFLRCRSTHCTYDQADTWLI